MNPITWSAASRSSAISPIPSSLRPSTSPPHPQSKMHRDCCSPILQCATSVYGTSSISLAQSPHALVLLLSISSRFCDRVSHPFRAPFISQVIDYSYSPSRAFLYYYYIHPSMRTPSSLQPTTCLTFNDSTIRNDLYLSVVYILLNPGLSDHSGRLFALRLTPTGAYSTYPSNCSPNRVARLPQPAP